MKWAKFRNITLVAAGSLALNACGGGGSDGGGTPPPPPPPPPPPADTAAPQVSFSPAAITLDRVSTGSSTLTATDNVGVTSGPDVTCPIGSFANNTYTYQTGPGVTLSTRRVTIDCVATASDAAGNRGSATLRVTIIPPDTEAPVLSFSPGTLDVASGATAAATLTATDNVGVTTGPDVTCTQGSFANDTYTAPVVSVDTEATCTATATDAAGNEGEAELMISITAPQDTDAPVVSLSPSALTIPSSGGDTTVQLVVTDNVGVVGLGFDDSESDSCGDFSMLTGSGNVSVEIEPERCSDDPRLLTTTATRRLECPVAVSLSPGDGTPVGGSFSCEVSAADAAGNEGTATFTVSIAAPQDTEAPVVTFSPPTLSVQSGRTVPVTLTATDNVDDMVVPVVTCTLGSFANNMYSAPDVSAVTTATCTATATDAADNESTAATLAIIIAAPVIRDTEAPVVSLNPDSLTIPSSGGGGTLQLVVTDNVGVDLASIEFADINDDSPTVRCDSSMLTGNWTRSTQIEGACATTDRTIARRAECPVTVSISTVPGGVSPGGSFRCEIEASDAAGNTGRGTFTVSITAPGTPDTEAPVVSFSPAALEVASGATAAATLTATDNVGVTRGPGVTCTQGSFNVGNNTYTAPAVSVETTATCTATAFDAADNRGRGRLTVTITAPPGGADTTQPVVTFSPATLAVDSGGTGSSTLTATDNVAVTRGPSVTCTRGSFANDTYTAPVVSADTMATCTATATDAAGNGGTATLTVSITAPQDTEAPVLSFSPATLSVDSGGTGSSTLTATDNVAVTRGPTVTCTRGSFNVGNNTYTAPDVDADTTARCTATAFDAAGNRGRATLRVSITAPVTPGGADTTPPVVSISPSRLTFSGFGGVRSVDITITDNFPIPPGSVSVDCDTSRLTPTALSNINEPQGEFRVGVRPLFCRATEGQRRVQCSSSTVSVDAPTFSRLSGVAACTVGYSDAAGNEGTATLTLSFADSNSAAPAAPCPAGFTESPNSPLGDTTLCTGPLGNLSEFGGVLTQSATIPYMEGVAYELSGRLDVGQPGPGTCPDDAAPVVLTIEPGVTIVGNSGDDVLVVNRCHRIEAAGTPDRPIVFTSKNDIAGTGERESATGEWGGVVILGDAPINRCQVPGATGGTFGCENTVGGVTGPDALYGGGGAPDSSSGTLEYVTVRHAGADLGAGLTFGGVGSGTTVNYV
ncbi:MAG: hypothetical protein GDA35_02310, partial [Hyphomonadaceae bacterium]|nr:hypothetical protein [Hyphomonadaceae bacterium]